MYFGISHSDETVGGEEEQNRFYIDYKDMHIVSKSNKYNVSCHLGIP